MERPDYGPGLGQQLLYARRNPVLRRFVMFSCSRRWSFRLLIKQSGLAESTFYPAIQYVIGSWYKGEELAKRACIFHVSIPPPKKPTRKKLTYYQTASAIGPMFSGFLQTVRDWLVCNGNTYLAISRARITD